MWHESELYICPQPNHPVIIATIHDQLAVLETLLDEDTGGGMYLRSHAAVRHLEQRGRSGLHAIVW